MQSHVTNFNQSECIILELFFSEIFKPMILGSGDKVNMVETKFDFYMLGEKIYHLLWHKKFHPVYDTGIRNPRPAQYESPPIATRLGQCYKTFYRTSPQSSFHKR